MEITNKFNSLIANPTSARAALLKYGPALVTLLLVLLIAGKLASLTWLLLDKPRYDATAVATQGAAPAVMDENINETINKIVTANLFGKYDPEQPPVAGPDPEIVPVANLNSVTLKGTVASTSDTNGLAIVEKDGGDFVFTIGDTVAPGYELKRVFADQIHLSKAGVIERLMLPKLSEQSPNSSPQRGNRSSASRPSRPASRSANLQQIASSGPAKLGDLLRPQPVFQNGKQLGYRVYPGRKREQFGALGLKAGDLVTEINGTPLDDPSRGLEIFRSLNESTQVAVTIQRNGAQTSLVLDTSQLNLAGER